MGFDPQNYGDTVASILHLEGAGQRPMPLATNGGGSVRVRDLIRDAGARGLLPRVALAGLYLYFDCWQEAHETAQDIATREGSYWHAIVHRMEPDAFNSGYWFRRVGEHAIFPALRDAAAGIGIDLGPRWKPEAFVDLCECAREDPGSELERQAREVQLVEWQLLFDYCAR
ncbi:MAG: hypothetical protein WDO73_06015 [Ignavibacteriota bacterium]